jgi:PAS domain S-box-containing protein
MDTNEGNARKTDSALRLYAVTALLTGGAFLLDLLTPLGVATWLLYSIPLLVISRARKPLPLLVFAAAATALIVTGFYHLEPDPAAPEHGMYVANRLLAVGALWVTAVVLAQRRQAYETLRRAREALEERTRELVVLTEELRAEIKQRREVEDALTAAKTFRETIEDSLIVGLVAVDHDGRILSVNDAFCAMTGWGREELLGTGPPYRFWPPEEIETIRAAAWKTLGKGSPLAAQGFVLLRRSGERFPVLVYASPFRDPEGNLKGYVGSVTDISEHKKAEAALRESEERFRTLVEHSLVGFFIVQEGEVVFLNPEQLKLFGNLPEGYVLERLAARIHPGDLSRFAALLMAMHGGDGRAHEADFRYVPFGPEEGEDGPGDDAFSGRRLRWIHCRTSPIAYRGRDAVLVNMVDITQLKEFERIALIQEKMASLGQVAAGIAHEIRNPLSGLNLYLSAGERMVAGADGVFGETLEDLRTVFSQMKSVSGKIERIVRSVMEFARPEPLRLEFIDVCEAVHEAVRVSAATVRKRGVRLEEMSCGNLPRCRADVRLLEQVLLNLITNAVQAMERWAGEKRIEIGCAAEDGHIRITVADSGPGVPPHLRHRIFEPFFTTKKEGTGIGLSISHKIVSDHGGFLTVGTSKWGGALFTIGIPIGAVDFMADI